MHGNVPLTITINDAFSPYSNHPASDGAWWFSSHSYLWPFGFQICLCPTLHGHQPNRTRASRAQPLARLAVVGFVIFICFVMIIIAMIMITIMIFFILIIVFIIQPLAGHFWLTV